jgi:hypothetical protein
MNVRITRTSNGKYHLMAQSPIYGATTLLLTRYETFIEARILLTEYDCKLLDAGRTIIKRTSTYWWYNATSAKANEQKGEKCNV